MAKLEYEQLLVNENAYFFKLNRPFVKRDIEIVFEESLKHKNAKRVFEPRLREPYVHGPKEIAKVSIDIFKFNKRPSFLTEDVRETFELKYGLFIIIETADLVAIVKKNVSGIKHFYSIVERIDYNVLVRFLLNPESKYEKIVSSNMNIASNAMQRKTSEGSDLQSVLSRFGTSKQIIDSIRVANKENKSTVTLNTSRVNSFNVQNEFGPAVVWMVEMMGLIRKSMKTTPQSNFIDSFATPIQFESIIDDIIPTYLVIRLDALKDEIESGQVQRIFNSKTNKKVDFNKDVLDHDRLFSLKLDKTGVYLNDHAIVKVREELIAITILPFKDLIIDFGDDYEIDLNTYLNTRSHFIIVFDKLQYVYSHGKIFEDSKLLGDKENFMSTFIPFDPLKNIDSEKGSAYLPGSKQFSPNSLFSFVDNEFGPTSNYLLCDDMGTEWGDFISIGDDEISFFHLKHNKDGLSAANLEAVFGQAQKNFGFLQLTEEMIEQRRTKWNGFYKWNHVITSIKRMRKSLKGKESIDDLLKYSSLVSSNPNVRRKVFIVVNFISKDELSKAFDSLVKGKIFTNHGAILQMLWFIQGSLSLANELGVEFRILCRP